MNETPPKRGSIISKIFITLACVFALSLTLCVGVVSRGSGGDTALALAMLGLAGMVISGAGAIIMSVVAVLHRWTRKP